MNKEKVDKIIEIRNRAEKIIKPLDEQLEKCHKQNLEASEKLYPKVNDKQENRVIDLMRRISVLADSFSSPRLK